MLAFALPVVWAFSGLSVVGFLSRISSGLGTFSVLAENWKLKKLVNLGIPKDLIHPPTRSEDEEGLREMARMMRAQRGESTILDDEFRPFVVTIQHENEEIAGQYAFVCVDEYRQFADSIRHYNLVVGEGPEAEQLRSLLEGTGVEYRKLQFLWNDYAPIYKQMKRLSEARLKDAEFRKLLQTDAFHQNTK